MPLETLVRRIAAHRFHSDDAVDAAIRHEGARRASSVFPAINLPGPIRMDTNESVFSAMMCNDLPYPGDAAYHKARIASVAQRFPATNGAGLQYHCVYWGGPHAMRAPLSRINGAGDILMVHAERDPITPLHSALAAFETTPVAHLLVADGIGAHGVFGFTDSACIEDTVGRYLLGGSLPADRMSRCDAVPAAHGGPGSGFTRPAHAATLRSELADMSAPFAR
jgi:hypothetical protein